MCDEKITLWTIHSPEFDLTSGRVYHSKSEYYRCVPGVKETYRELWHRLNTPEGQVIWCYTENGHIAKTDEEKMLWELQIPREKVICFLDSLVLCKPSIYRFLLVSNGHPLCQKSSTCISRASFYSL